MNSSGLAGSGGYGPTDNLKDLQNFIHKHDPTALITSTPTVNTDAVKINNCSPCPILATITLKDGVKGSTATIDRKVFLKPGEIEVYDWGSDVIVSLTTEEADMTGVVDGSVDVNALVGLTTPSQMLEIKVNFFNS